MPDATQEKLDRLSRTERDLHTILRAQGVTVLTNAQLGQLLGVTPWTVSRHLNLLRALELIRIEGASSDRVIYAS